MFKWFWTYSRWVPLTRKERHYTTPLSSVEGGLILFCLYFCFSDLRDGPFEKLWGGGGGEGEFSSRRNFFSLANSLFEFFYVIAWIFFRINWRARIVFHLIFPCANFFSVLRPPPPPDKFSNDPSLKKVSTRDRDGPWPSNTLGRSL